MAADYTKSQVTALAHQLITTTTTTNGAAQDSSTDIAAIIVCYHAALTTSTGIFSIQISPEASGDASWGTIASLPVGRSSGASTSLTATEPAGETAIAVSDSSSFAAGDYIYIEDVGTTADSEWALVQEIPDANTITIVDGLTNGKDSLDRALLNAEHFVVPVNLAGVARWRVIFDSSATDQHVMVLATVLNSLSEV